MRTRTFYIVAILSALAAAYLLFGSNLSFKDVAINKHVADKKRTNLFEVEARWSEPTSYAKRLVLTSYTEPSVKIPLYAYIPSQVNTNPGTVEKELVPAGTFVKAKTPLMQLSKEQTTKLLSIAKSRYDEKEMYLKGTQKLVEKGFASKIDLQKAESDFNQAAIDFLLAQEHQDHRTVVAPFDGVVLEYFVEVGERLTGKNLNNTGVASFAKLDPLTINAYVSHKDIAYISRGDKVNVSTSDGTTHVGWVSAIKGVSEDALKTFEVKVILENKEYKIRAGIPVRVHFNLSKKPAHHIRSSLLSYSSEGRLGIKIVDQYNHVKFVPIEILNEKNGHYHVHAPTQLEKVKVITRGHEFVTDGQKVKVSLQ